MTETEKSVILNNLVAFMEEYPIKGELQAEMRKTSFLKPESSPFFSRFTFAPAFKLVAIVLVIAIVAGGSVSYTAASALPGDLLYPAKVYFNEAIVSAIKLTPEAKATYAKTRVEARLAEAETLITKGKFDTDRQNRAEAAIDEHMHIVRTRIGKLPPEKREKFTRTTDEVLVAKVAKHRARVAAFANNRPSVETTAPAVKNTEILLSETGTEGTIPVSPTIPTNNTTSSSQTTPGVITPTEIDIAKIAEREISKAVITVDELRKTEVKYDAIHTKLESRIAEIDKVVHSAKIEFREGNYRDAIALARKAIQSARMTKEAVARLIAEMNTAPGTSPTPTPERP